MSDKPDWERFFDNHAPNYMENAFTKNTMAEVDFLIEVLGLSPGQTILDVGCGTGRHAVELAKRGYQVTGIDLSAGMIEEGRRAAEAASVSVEFIKADATQFRSAKTFDAVICLCEGAFNLLGDSGDPIDHDLAVLGSIHAALEPGGPFLLTALLAYRHLKALFAGDIDTSTFDPINMIEFNTMGWEEQDGSTHELVFHERSYTPSELRLLLRCAGFDVLHLWGGTAGNWGKRPIDLFEYEMMAVCRRKQTDKEL